MINKSTMHDQEDEVEEAKYSQDQINQSYLNKTPNQRDNFYDYTTQQSTMESNQITIGEFTDSIKMHNNNTFE